MVERKETTPYMRPCLDEDYGSAVRITGNAQARIIPFTQGEVKRTSLTHRALCKVHLYYMCCDSAVVVAKRGLLTSPSVQG